MDIHKMDQSERLKEKTIGYYNQYAEQFAKRTEGFDMSFCQDRFMKYLPEQALILDAGCGSGRDAKVFLEKGFRVCAMDASETMCRVAEQRIGQPVVCMRFEEMEWQEHFDGIWACASLLHVARRALPAVLENFCRALKPGGILYASFKNGDGEEERLGRFFNDYRMEALEDAFLRGGMFELVESFETEDVRPDYKDKPWVNIIVRKRQA